MIGYNVFTFLCIVCLHIIADYLMQNKFLSDYKQKKNWKPYVEQNKSYKNDYIMVLVTHAFLWSFITFLPLYIINVNESIKSILVIILNTVVHAFIDNLKCNKLRINLIQDQLFHLMQMLVTFILCYIC